MGRNPSTFAKRQREQQRQQKRAEKQRKRADRQSRDAAGTRDGAPGEDPDIAGIVPGPQAQPWMDGPDDAPRDELADNSDDEPAP